MELFITLGVFLSSFLILTVEKDWWGGHLTGDQEKKWTHNGIFWSSPYQQVKQDPAYRVENTIRLIILGNSLSFFMIIILCELFQSIFTLVYVLMIKLRECAARISILPVPYVKISTQ